jgi:serine protease inhibitor
MDVLQIMIRPVLQRAAVLFIPAVVTACLALPALAAAAETPQPGAVEIDPAARQLLAGAQAKLAFNLIEKVSAGAAQQATISPASLASAFSLVSVGADARMKEAIARTLGFTERGDAGLAALADLHEKLAKGTDSFAFADKLVFAPSNAPSKYVQGGLKELGVPWDVADLSTPDGAKKIDEWVNGATKGAIPELLGGPASKAAFAALNALHFKSRWKTPFDAQLTSDAPFAGIDGKSAEVRMMRLGKGMRSFRQERIGDRGFVAIDLPFADERFSLVVATTTDKPAAGGKPGGKAANASPAAPADFKPVAAWLSGEGFAVRSGDLAMPRFSASAREDLTKTLNSLGLDKGKSPTALIRFGDGIELSQVIQRTMIEVNEEGAEAAAATAVIGTRNLEADDSIHMIVDKPFIFSLRDKQTGLILVAGYVGTAPKVS